MFQICQICLSTSSKSLRRTVYVKQNQFAVMQLACSFPVVIPGYCSWGRETKCSKQIASFTWYLILGNNLAVLFTMLIYIVLLRSRMIGLSFVFCSLSFYRVLDTTNVEETFWCVWYSKFFVQLLHHGLYLEVTLLKVSSIMLQVYINCWSLNVLFLNPCIRSFNASFIDSILASSVQPLLLLIHILQNLSHWYNGAEFSCGVWFK